MRNRGEEKKKKATVEETRSELKRVDVKKGSAGVAETRQSNKE